MSWPADRWRTCCDTQLWQSHHPYCWMRFGVPVITHPNETRSPQQIAADLGKLVRTGSFLLDERTADDIRVALDLPLLAKPVERPRLALPLWACVLLALFLRPWVRT